MVTRKYEWADGAKLKDHTRKKHQILKEYFSEYLRTRCSLPKQEKFKLAVVDGFAGGGVYDCGSFGSPLIFIDTLKKAFEIMNIERISQDMRPIAIDCLMIFNDDDRDVIELLKENIQPYIAEIKENQKNLNIKVKYFNQQFQEIYPSIKLELEKINCRNVIFNLDQCGYSKVNPELIKFIMQSWTSPEVFLTFSIESLLAFITDNEDNNKILKDSPDLLDSIYQFKSNPNDFFTKKTFLGQTERIVFEYLKSCARYVSPFSINNPDGWRYWLMHFSNAYRARQVYNNILHKNSTMQAHYGRSGLKMLTYNPADEGGLYLFNEDSRTASRKSLFDDIPRLISSFGDALLVEDFYASAYNETPAHSDDIHEMMIQNPDVNVITVSGGERRKHNTIKPVDIVKISDQKSMFSMFSGKNK